MKNPNPLDAIPQNEWDALIISIITPFLPLCNRDTLINMDDLKQEAWLGLLKACENYDANRARFTTYAYSYIRGYIMTYISRSTRNKPHQVDEDASELDEREYEDTTMEKNDFMVTVFDLVKNEEYSELLEEHFVRNKSFRTLAKEIGVSHVTIANRVNHLLNVLESRLSHENA